MKLVVFFPWGTDCIIKRNNGAGLRVGLMMDFLSAHGVQIDCISLSWRETKHVSGNITYADRRLFNLSSYLLYGLAVKLGAYTKWVFPQALLLYFFPRLNKRFKIICEQAIKNAEFVFLEYPFWTIPIKELSVLNNKPMLMTNYDQAWKSWTDNGPLRDLSASILRRLEISAMGSVEECVVVSKNDQDAFNAWGIRTTVIPNSIDCERQALAGEQIVELRRKWGLPLSGRSAMFVGGGWFPNSAAVANICRNIAPLLPDVEFYIIGRCSDNFLGQKPDNVYFIRNADNLDLEFFYTKVELVLVPILQGTGSSLKMIEALSKGKVVLSTSVGARGLEMVSGKHAIIEDDLTKYPELIRCLFANDGLRDSMRKNARQFAVQYDYRRCNQTYLDILERFQPLGRVESP
jgi:glycosyltransferase involved in cell wall biosynthesis